MLTFIDLPVDGFFRTLYGGVTFQKIDESRYQMVHHRTGESLNMTYNIVNPEMKIVEIRMVRDANKA